MNSIESIEVLNDIGQKQKKIVSFEVKEWWDFVINKEIYFWQEQMNQLW